MDRVADPSLDRTITKTEPGLTVEMRPGHPVLLNFLKSKPNRQLRLPRIPNTLTEKTVEVEECRRR